MAEVGKLKFDFMATKHRNSFCFGLSTFLDVTEIPNGHLNTYGHLNTRTGRITRKEMKNAKGKLASGNAAGSI